MKRFVARGARWALWLWLAGALASATAQTATATERKAAEAVQEALRCELRGDDAQRGRLLQAILKDDPGCAAALWHSGYVREGDRWVKFSDSPGASADDATLAEYRRRRDQSADTIEGRLELARWCSQHQLRDQARAHLIEVLRKDPDNAQARRRLDHRWVAGVWLSPEEIAEFRKQADRTLKDLRAWLPEMKKLRYGLAQRDQRKRQEAIDRFLAIRDPAAVGAIECLVAGSGEDAARLAIAVLEKMPGKEASLALARLAVYAPVDTIRQEAAQRLRARRLDLYVPALLSAMSTPVESRAELFVTPRGRLMYRQVLYREGQYQAERMVLDSEYRDPVAPAGASGGDPFAGLLRLLEQDAANRVQGLEGAVAQQNEAIGQINQRVCEVLATATGQSLGPLPERWWQWWNDYNESYLPGEKPVQESYNYQELSTPTPTPPARYECLIAGTPVWTSTGMVPIEQVCVGDRVLSQDPQTGELAYKPVLGTTVRPPVRLVKVVFDGEALQSSGGHPFWVAGEGWVKARDLKPGARLHAVTGTSQVWSVHSTGVEETYNLIVADFHTYFVTKAKILSHDNTIREPTDALVPGLVER